MDNKLTKPHVRCCVVHPGFVQTDMILRNKERINPQALAIEGYEKYSKGMSVEKISNGFKSIGSTTPKAAAKQILDGIRWNKTRILVGNDCVIFDILVRMFPRL